MPTYSFGEDSPLKFEIPEKLAERYNQAVDKFIKAQQRFNQKFGRQWDPLNDPIDVKWNRKQQQAWNKVGLFIATARDTGLYQPNDFMDDFLVLNAASLASSGSKLWGRALPIAVGFGVLYGLLRGR